MSWFKSNVLEQGNDYKIVTWADGTDEEIAAMLAAHYEGKIDISDYWAVGDKRKIHLNAMSATGVSESHHADDYDFVIIGIKHDDLTTPINGITKAAITIQLDRMLFTDTTTEYDSSYDTAHEYGYMNSSNTNAGGWTSCARRTWCNSVFFGALPQTIQDTIKQVDKKTSAGSQSSTINTDHDKIFLLSEIEIFGTTTYSFSGEGSQYSYFTTASNRYKKPRYDSSYVSGCWWERSPRSSGSSAFCIVGRDGSAGSGYASSTFGLVPACAL